MPDSKPQTDSTKPNQDNRSRQLNPNNDAYWRSRGEQKPPPSDQKRK